jgi:ribonuclease BN (tRNA processing enzyme)
MKIDIRMYNVGFGDCFLVSLRDSSRKRPYRMLFDCGRLAGSRQTNEAAGETSFEGVIDQLINDVRDPADDTPKIDVIVATHRHRDHIHGFSLQDKWKQVEVTEVWLPWVEDPQNPFARSLVAKQELLANRTFHALTALRAAAGGNSSEADSAIDIAYNSTRNAKAMATLQSGTGFKNTNPRVRYLPRAGHEPEQLRHEELARVLPEGVVVHVLGPSRDPATIKLLDPPSGVAYEPLAPAQRSLDDSTSDDAEVGRPPRPFDVAWIVDVGAYAFLQGENAAVEKLVSTATLEPLELVYRLDNAINGTSLVLLLEVGDKKLFFPGDAQWGTWKMMQDNPATWDLLTGTNVYKVGHHGSHNATPKRFVEECLSSHAESVSLLSVAPTSYGGGWKNIPLPTLVDALKEKTEVHQTWSDDATAVALPYDPHVFSATAKMGPS